MRERIRAANNRLEASNPSSAVPEVEVEVEIDRSQATEVTAFARKRGATLEGRYGDTLHLRLPVEHVEQLAELDGVRVVRSVHTPVPSSLESEGAPLIDPSGWWSGSGFTGAGIRVAVIDVGFAGYQHAQLTGELPLGLEARDFCGGRLSSGSQHGTAAASIIHDIAPGAELLLLCVSSATQLGEATDYAISRGARIISHSVSWLNTSRGDGTGKPGTPDAIALRAREQGALWINAAGNTARTHWSGDFRDDDSDGYHEFAHGDEGNGLVIPIGTEACVALKWDDWVATSQDFDLYLLRSRDGAIVAASFSDQAGGLLSPTEQVCYRNPGPDTVFHAAIRRAGATTSPRLDLFVFGYVQEIEHKVGAGSVVEPASAPHVMAVGALCWRSTGATPVIQGFSAQGPTIAGVVKPDISGYDSVSAYGFAAGTQCGSGFVGTSAAAPHVAGAAAMALQSQPNWSPAELQAQLESWALLEDPGVPGKDPAFGAGRVTLRAPSAQATASATPAGTQLSVVDVTDAAVLTAFTVQGGEIALPSHDTGGRALGLLRDGVVPVPGTVDYTAAYDTYGAGNHSEVVLRYEFASARAVTALQFQEGLEFPNGGTGSQLRARARVGGSWQVLEAVTTPPYPGGQGASAANGISFEVYTLTFAPITAEAVELRVSLACCWQFLTVAEFRVFGPGTAVGSAPLPSSSPAPASTPSTTVAAPLPPPPSIPVRDVTAGALLSAFTATGTALPAADGGGRVLALLQDGAFPTPGSIDYAAGYDTYGIWGSSSVTFRYELPVVAPVSRVDFIEGMEFPNGGTAVRLRVFVREQGGWSQVTSTPTVSGYDWSPPYAGANGQHFDRYSITFPPRLVDAVQIVAELAGTYSFVSIAELRVYAHDDAALAPDLGTTVDISTEGGAFAGTSSESSGFTVDLGGRSITLMSDGVMPEFGTVDFNASFDTYRHAPQAAQAWIGYTFPGARTFTGLRFQAGMVFPNGGWFAHKPEVEVRIAGKWTKVDSTSTGVYSSAGAEAFTHYEFSFAPVAGDGIRLNGAPGGAAAFVSVAELRVIAAR